MDIIKNFPFFSIFLSMFGGTLSSVLPRKAARIANMVIMTVIAVMSGVLLAKLWVEGESYIFILF